MTLNYLEDQFVTFGLGEEIFALQVAVVREILNHAEPFKIPNAPEYFLGLRDVRGQGVPTIDLRLKLGMAATITTENTRVLVVDIPAGDRILTYGLVADRVFEVVTFSKDRMEAAPNVGSAWRSDYIASVVRRETGFVVIIDLPRLLSSRVGLFNRAAAPCLRPEQSLPFQALRSIAHDIDGGEFKDALECVL